MKIISPLRYPGGKAIIYNMVSPIITDHNLGHCVYVEPFAGGFGLGLKLMQNDIMHDFIINDYDYHIYAFWKVLFFHTNKLIDFIENVKIDLNEWDKQKEIYNKYVNYSLIEVACSTFFLNRTNYSGIMKGGPIGGRTQKGNYKINCRFNKNKLIECIKEIAKYKKQVKIYNLDAKQLINRLENNQEELFFNFDPPYFVKGKELYTNFYDEKNHIELKEYIQGHLHTNWIMTYDNNDFIKDLYKQYYIKEYELSYYAGKKKKGKEFLISNFVI